MVFLQKLQKDRLENLEEAKRNLEYNIQVENIQKYAPTESKR